MSIFHNNMLGGAGGQSNISIPTISRSLRFNSASSKYLSRTFGTPTTQGTFTLSLWCKRSALGVAQQLFGVSTNHSFGFTAGDTLNLTFGGTSALTTTAVFRDPSAWYHIVWTQNGTSHTIYVNNVSVGTATATSSVFNTAVAHQIGAANTSSYLSGYLAEIYFIDGQALVPSNFGQSDGDGVWQPKTYSGTYGANSFHLEFADNSAATAAALGKDTSGKGNNWTPTNFSVTAGAGNDALVDSPAKYGTDTGAGGEVRGNYCTWNPLSIAGGALSNGNLDATHTGQGLKQGTISFSAGKWYWEVTMTSTGDSMVGIVPASSSPVAQYLGITASQYGYYGTNGNKYNNATQTAYGATFTNGDTVGVALDLGAGTLVFYKNGVSQGTAFTSLSGTFCPAISSGGAGGASTSANFGQRAFAYAAPSGYKAPCTQNLTSTTITTSGSYTGNGSADGPFVYLNGVPTAMTINGNAVTFGSTADKLANGFKVRTSSSTYNQNASNYTYSITSIGDPFLRARAQFN